MENVISFPGLGIKDFTVKEIAFSLFGRNVAWYGIIITFGIILAVLYVMNRAKYEGIKEDDILDYAIFVIPIAIIGARVYYVLTSLDQYDTFGEAIAIWEGGLAIYGAIIFGALTALVVSLIKKINILKIFDMLCPAVMIGQMIGRWGNFVNVEAFGGPTKSIFRMCSPEVTSDFLSKGLVSFEQLEELTNGIIGAHPTFLYESIWSLVGFLLINAYYKKKKYHGEIFFMYISWYGFGRFLIEGLRTDSLYIGIFRISQVIGLVSFIVGISFLLVLYFKKAKGRKPILLSECNNGGKVVSEAKENGEDN